MLYKNAYWFVWAYIVLYIMAPMLNAFIEKSDKQTLKRFLVLFFVIQTIASIFANVGFYKAGYDPLSFIGLYLLARYFRLYKENSCKYIYLFIFALCVLLNTLACFLPPFIGLSNGFMFNIAYMYTNPLNIIGALSLLLFFTKLDFKSRAVNYIATSCFAVYLLHMHFCVRGYYIDTAKELYYKFSGISYFATIITLFVAVFIVSIILDRIRIICFNYLWNKYEKRKHQ
ncbi:MAG: acyltransferase family protein [Bacteroidaceae bacterium]|nr:acyltransferase family protein [Bacteroidaceae bacterium]